jgi:hypothetical protein
MSELELRRWKQFSLRMAHRGFNLRLRKSRRRLAWFVKDFFRALDCEYFAVNETLPVRLDPKWGFDFNDHTQEFLRDRIVDWDHTEDHPTWRDQYGHSTCGPFICDIVTIAAIGNGMSCGAPGFVAAFAPVWTWLYLHRWASWASLPVICGACTVAPSPIG